MSENDRKSKFHGTRARGDRPAHPKYAPLTGTDYVCFKAPGAYRSQLGHVLAPKGGERNAEIEGDEVRIPAEQGGRVYLVPRGDVEVLHGKSLMRAQESGEKKSRSRPLRQKKALRPSDLPYLRAVPQSNRPDPGSPAPLRLVHCGPAQLLPVPKKLPPVRSDAYREFVRGRVCIACERENRPTEAHHEGPHGFGVKSDDLWCVPLCAGFDGCPRFYTNKNHLPGLSRVASVALMHDAQRILVAEFCRRLLLLLVPPALVGDRPSAEEQHLFDLLNEKERSVMAARGQS